MAGPTFLNPSGLDLHDKAAAVLGREEPIAITRVGDGAPREGSKRFTETRP